MKLNKTDDAGSSAYSAVLLINGDVYFGKLSWFPTPRIEGALILQRSVDEKNQVQLSLQPVKDAFWKPVDEVMLNPDQIVSWSRLRNDSQVAQALANPDALRDQQGQLPVPAATSTPGR